MLTPNEIIHCNSRRMSAKDLFCNRRTSLNPFNDIPLPRSNRADNIRKVQLTRVGAEIIPRRANMKHESGHLHFVCLCRSQNRSIPENDTSLLFEKQTYY